MIVFKCDAKILLAIMQERLQIQFQFFDALDSKAASLFAVGSALLGILAAVFAIREEFERDGIIVISVAAAAYLFVVLAVAFSHWPRRYQVGPAIEEIWDDAQVKENNEFLSDLIVDYIHYYRDNDRNSWVKPWAVRVGLVAILVETASIAAGLAVVA
ncbi:MAG: hypothetical protein WD379_07490 [Dehalococcoidia bacterium]